MNRRFVLAFIIVLVPIIVCALSASSCVSSGGSGSGSGVASSVKPTTEIIRGRVKIYGNEPHTYAGIETEDASKIYAVSPKEMDPVIRELQGHLIEFKVIMNAQPEVEASLYLKDGTIKLVAWKIIE